ncbi:hypothetical protein RB620_18290 [Paenibacillus sp. LHD-117]|uniref:hypothetical protein n=1 Tax=Paenibacillus sp. LHD-117 TaxID=3071412 RepID=UPI0027E00BE4|nr:hypothetical protein [Paenibacillus sp. LHD-117]MDQ6421380.1 hypothetical protein [Paenibacillus sp. LHD-117]
MNMVVKPEKKVLNASKVIRQLENEGWVVIKESPHVKATRSKAGFSALVGSRNRPLVIKDSHSEVTASKAGFSIFGW